MKNKNNQEMKNHLNLEEILKERGLLTKESIFRDIIKNKTVRQLGKVILAAAFISGVIVASAMAPNLFGALGKLGKTFGGGKKQKLAKNEQQKIIKSLYNLRNNKLIKWDKRGDKIMLKITPRGRTIFLRRRLHELKIEKQEKWDKIWRVVIFDIPNNLGGQRDVFRQRLKNMGFFQFQKSAFIIPYPCRQELEAVLDYYQLFDYVTYLEASSVSGQEKCRQYFDL